MSAEDNEERRQLADIRDQLQRAKRMSLQTPTMKAQRREILKKLISLVHSPYSSLKSYSANNIKLFIKEFDELEDDAINAVYDLCEDQDPRVRKDGYRAITQVSREQKKWVKRNADVLVQLLQSDEPEEVEVVEQQLTEHLDMDPKVTLGVLCDQIVPPEDAIDDEDQAIRDRLRGLVLGFMVGRAKRAIVERHAQAAEIVFAEGLMKTMFKLPSADVDMIVKDIFLSLPSFGRYSHRGEELLDLVLVEAKASMNSELSSGEERSPQTKTRPYLNLAANLAIEKHVARPTNLLHFYCQNFASKVILAKFTEDMRVFVIENFANALSSLQENAPKMVTPSAAEVIELRNKTVDVCYDLFSCLVELNDVLHKPWQACKTLLQACVRRHQESGWNPPEKFIPILNTMESQVNLLQDKDLTQEVTYLIRSLLEQPKPQPKPSPVPSPASTSSTNNAVVKGMTSNGKLNGGAVHIKRKREDSNTSQRPSAAASIQTQANLARRSTNDHEWLQKELAQDARGRSHTAPTPGSSSRATPTAEQEPASKRKKGAGGEGAVPSLLSRLAITTDVSQRLSPPSSSIPAKRRAESEGTQGKRPNVRTSEADVPPGGYSIKGADQAQRSNSQQPKADAPAGGWSIKGAARRHSPPKEAPSSSSLLDRLNKSSDGDSGGKGRKRRTKT